MEATTTMSNPLEDMIQASLDQDYNKASKVFGDLMGTKLNDALDAEKIKIAGQIYNGEEADEEQLDLPLEDEEASVEEEDTEAEADEEAEVIEDDEEAETEEE